jgi:predicted transposase YdaD
MEVGFTDRWEARGEERKALEIAGNMLAGGFSVEQTAQLTGLDLEKVGSLA